MTPTRLFGLTFLNKPLAVLAKTDIPTLIHTPPFKRLITLNPEMLLNSLHDPEAYTLLKTGLCVADGIGLTLPYRILTRSKLYRIPGIDLVIELITSPYRIYIVGSTPDTLEKATQRLQAYPCQIIGTHHGYFDETQATQLMSDIAQKSPDIVLVAMGYPKQEIFLKELENHLQNGIGIGIGGALDILSGTHKRAPKPIRKIGLEWAWRILIDPRRIRRLKWLTKIPNVWRHTYWRDQND